MFINPFSEDLIIYYAAEDFNKKIMVAELSRSQLSALHAEARLEISSRDC